MFQQFFVKCFSVTFDEDRFFRSELVARTGQTVNDLSRRFAGLELA